MYELIKNYQFDILLEYLKKLPNIGTVANTGDFWYIKLDDEWGKKTNEIIKMLEVASSPKDIETSVFDHTKYPHGKFLLYAPCYPGFHVTILPNSLQIGTKVKLHLLRWDNFHVDNIYVSGAYSTNKQQTINLYWYTLQVKISPKIKCKYDCHISIAARGYRMPNQ